MWTTSHSFLLAACLQLAKYSRRDMLSLGTNHALSPKVGPRRGRVVNMPPRVGLVTKKHSIMRIFACHSHGRYIVSAHFSTYTCNVRARGPSTALIGAYQTMVWHCAQCGDGILNKFENCIQNLWSITSVSARGGYALRCAWASLSLPGAGQAHAVIRS